MEYSDLKTKSKAELQTLCREQKARLQHLRFQVAEKQLKKVSEIKKTRRLIARVSALLAQKTA